MNIYASFTKKELREHVNDWECYDELIECLNDANYELKPNSENGIIDKYSIDENGKFFKNGKKTTKAELINDAYNISLALAYAKYWSDKEIREFFNLN